MKRLVLLCAWIGLNGCTTTNEADPVCGDGIRDTGEACDDGNNAPGDGCSATCALEPFCGDGTVDPGEECDDNNVADGDGCSAICEIEPYCGDSVLDAGEACDDGNNAPSDGCSPGCAIEVKYATTANWGFRTVQSPTPLLCPTGAETAAVYTQLIDATDTAVGTPLIDLFDCVDGTGTIVPVFQGRYRTYIDFTNTAGTVTYASSTSSIVDLTASNQSFSTTLYTNGGYFSIMWNLVGATSNGVLTCAQVPTQDSVSVLSTNVANSSSFFEDLYECVDGVGLTAVLPAATYTVSVAVLNSSNQSLGTAPALTNKLIQGPNKVTDLGTVTIPVDGL